MTEPKNEALEDAIRRAPDDDGLRLAYADWLQQQGNARGELAMVQYLLAQKRLPLDKRSHKAPIAARGELERQEREFFSAHDALQLEVDATLTWKVGFIDSARIELYEAEALEETLEALFAHPSSRLVRTLELVADYTAGGDGALLDQAIALVAEHELPASLRCFTLTADVPWPDPDFPNDEPWPEVSSLPALFEAVPTMEALRVRGSLPSGIEWPRGLRRLAIETQLLLPAHLESLIQRRRPQLESLELWFGRSPVSLAHLDPILEGRVGTLTRLGLMNCEFSDALVPRLMKSPLLKRLAWLSLADGTLTDTGAQGIIDAASWFDDVETLDVSGNFVSDALAEELSAVCRTVILGEQRDEEWGVEPAYVER